MQINYFFIFLSMIYCNTLFASENIKITGSIEYALENNNKEIATILGSLNATDLQKCIEELLLENQWKIEKKDEKTALIFSDEELTRSYDFGYSNSGSKFETITTVTRYGTGNSSDSTVRSCHFHPSGKYLLVGGNRSAGVNSQIFAISETGSSLYALIECNKLHDNNSANRINKVRWSPDGQYYALAGTQSNNGVGDSVGTVTFRTSLRLYQFDETNKKSTLLPYAQIEFDEIKAVSWHPSQKYIAVGRENGAIRIYSFNENTFTQLPYCNKSTTAEIKSLDWHPSGNYLATGDIKASDNISARVYYFSEESLTELPNCKIDEVDSQTKWHPSGKYLALAEQTAINVYSFDNLATTLLTTTDFGFSQDTETIAWSPDGAYLTVGILNPLLTNVLCQFQDEIITALPFTNIGGSFGLLSENLEAVDWSPDGSFIAYVGKAESGTTQNIYLKQMTENTTELTRKNRGMLYQINNLIKQSYQDVLETQTLIQTTSSSAITANPLYLSPTSTLNSGIQFTNVAWDNVTAAAASLDPQYHDWHPSGKYIAVSEGSDGSGDNFLHIFAQETTATFKPLHSTFFPTIAGSDYRPQSLSWAPNGHFLSVQLGPSDFLQTENKIYSFDGSTLALTVSSVFFGRYAPAWHPNSSFLLTSTRAFIFRLLTFNNDYTSIFETGFGIPGSSTIGRGDWAPDGKSFFAWNSGTGAVGGYFYDFTSSTGSCVQLFSTGIPDTLISAISMRPQINITDESSYLAVGFNGSSPNLRVYQFNGVSQSTPSVTVIPGCSLNEESSVKNLAWSKDGQHLAVVWGGTPQYMQVYRFVENSWLSPTGLIVQNTDTGTGSLSWDPLSLFIAQAPSGSGVAPFIIRPDKYFHQNLLVAMSNECEAIASIPIDNALITANSNTIVTYNNLAKFTSQGWVTDYNLIIQNSNVINARLIGMSNAIAQLAVQTSYAIVNIDTLNKTTSNAIVANNLLNIQNSNVIVNYQPLLVNNSNAVAGLLIATSNAVAGLLVATSNATAGLLVATSYAAQSIAEKLIPLNTIDTGPSNIHFNSATITMTYNLNLSTDHQLFVRASGVVNGNGHSITFARGSGTQLTVDAAITTTFQNVIFKDYNEQATSLGAGASLIFGNNCRVEISEPQTLLRTWSFAGISQLNGLGNALTLGTGPRFLSSLISSSLQLTNLKLLNVRENNIRSANNNAHISFQDVTLNMSADYTYSIGSMLINNDVTLCGTSIFNYSTIMGLTVASASQLTIDQGVSFNYAPAGNFRNLLSLTNSSATIYFNNGTLVATSTGPRLTKGTLLIDGIMRIQSSGASSAEAIIFGDGTPANDLIVKLLPSATINLLSGFLNYANAN